MVAVTIRAGLSSVLTEVRWKCKAESDRRRPAVGSLLSGCGCVGLVIASLNTVELDGVVVEKLLLLLFAAILNHRFEGIEPIGVFFHAQ